MSAWLDEWPLLGLFFSAFISSTLLPGGSEALLLWQLKRGQDPYLLLSVATVGNVAGSLLTYGMGRWLRWRWPLRILSEKHRTAQSRLERYGPWALLLAWLPVIGDPLCLAAGWLRFSVWFSLVLITVGKAGRYLVVSGLVLL
ncbi:MAG: hypothetical protein CMI01_16150 [Oceanospirillaceae bacterium]|jgi:membrane protein YqaA with SNARE-associated domain|nr:hypothetical protein [Oceanospirillaceae bacterium]